MIIIFARESNSIHVLLVKNYSPQLFNKTITILIK